MWRLCFLRGWVGCFLAASSQLSEAGRGEQGLGGELSLEITRGFQDEVRAHTCCVQRAGRESVSASRKCCAGTFTVLHITLLAAPVKQRGSWQSQRNSWKTACWGMEGGQKPWMGGLSSVSPRARQGWDGAPFLGQKQPEITGMRDSCVSLVGFP